MNYELSIEVEVQAFTPQAHYFKIVCGALVP